MNKRVRLMLVALAATSVSCAHANDVSNLLRAFGRAVQEQQQKGTVAAPSPTPAPSSNADGAPPLTGGFNRVGRNIDTPENLTLLRSRVIARIEAADLRGTNDLALMRVCEEEMEPLSAYKMVIGTGYDQLRSKCEMEAREPIRQFQERQAADIRQQRAAEAAVSAKQQADKREQEERERTLAMAELRSGKRQPINCQQWIAARGEDPRELNAEVMTVAYETPKGVGFFSGRVEQIDGKTLLLSDQPVIRMHGTPQGYMVVSLAAAPKIFNGGKIKLGAVVEGFANQTGKRTLKMTDGSGQQAPVLVATCIHTLF